VGAVAGFPELTVCWTGDANAAFLVDADEVGMELVLSVANISNSAEQEEPVSTAAVGSCAPPVTVWFAIWPLSAEGAPADGCAILVEAGLSKAVPSATALNAETAAAAVFVTSFTGMVAKPAAIDASGTVLVLPVIVLFAVGADCVSPLWFRDGRIVDEAVDSAAWKRAPERFVKLVPATSAKADARLMLGFGRLGFDCGVPAV
jgi:hypothetical protein